MSEEVTLDDFGEKSRDEQRQQWKSVRIEDIASKRSENVDPQEVDLERHVGLEHIEPNTPYPKWETLDDLSSTKRRFEAGDILFAKLRPNLEKSAQPDFEGVASTDIFPIVAEEGVNSKYLLYRLSSKSAYDHARRTSVGTRMPRTSWNLFSNFEFDLPPLNEQRKIATVLYTIDKAIQETDEIIEQTRRVKQGVSQDVFRAGVGGNETKDVYLSAIEAEMPENWEVKPIGEIAERVTDGAHLTPDRSEDGYLLLSARNVRNGFLDLSEVDYVPEEEYERLTNRCNPEPGDILMSCSGMGLGRPCVVPDGLEFALVRSAALIKLSDSVYPEFIEQAIQHSWAQRQIQAYLSRSAQPNIFQGQIASIELPIPPVGEQRQIANILKDFDEEIDKQTEYSNQLERLKQGLMQDLLSGTVRTTDTNIEVPKEITQHG